MHYIFGPINSRRFGLSLGVDLSPDTKRCNFDCLYCELGKAPTTSSYDCDNQNEAIIEEITQSLQNHPNIDVITITANGEPTLYPYLHDLLLKINQIKKEKKLLILSNASTINDPQIEDSLALCDIVKLSLDSALAKSFQKIDRADSSIVLEDIKEGITTFANKHKTKLIIEILFVKGVNDSDEDIQALSSFMQKINPSRIDIGTIDRPPAYKVDSLSNERLLAISEQFRGQNISIAYHKNSNIQQDSYSHSQILQLLSRRPLSSSDIDVLFDQQSKGRFFDLVAQNAIHATQNNHLTFYQRSIDDPNTH
jgi:wyosine [tRNA(Phe)-imidazoG37] synthetase (radical SAM superfamily)